jgi:hypothetical protein
MKSKTQFDLQSQSLGLPENCGWHSLPGYSFGFKSKKQFPPKDTLIYEILVSRLMKS